MRTYGPRRYVSRARIAPYYRPSTRWVPRSRYTAPARPLGKTTKVPFENPKYCVLRTSGSASVTSTSGAFTADGNPWVVNSLYDPEQGGGAGQPRWFDQLATIYEKYAVYAVKIHVTAMGAEKMADVAIGVYDAGVPSTMRELEERDHCMKKTIDISTSGGKNSVLEFDLYVDLAKLLGIPRSQLMSDTTYLTNNDADPSKKVYLNFYVQGLGGQTASVTFQWTIQFYSKFANFEGVGDS